MTNNNQLPVSPDWDSNIKASIGLTHQEQMAIFITPQDDDLAVNSQREAMPLEEDTTHSHANVLPTRDFESPDSAHGYNYWRAPGENPKFYKGLGVLVFKELCPTTNRWVRKHTGLGKMPGGATKEEKIENLISITKLNEAIHLGMAAVTGFLQFKGIMLDSATAIAAFQVPMNLYPIMLQRYNRLLAFQKLDEIHSDKVD